MSAGSSAIDDVRVEAVGASAGGGMPSSGTRRAVRVLLDGLVRHCVALGVVALLALLALVLGLLTMVDIAFSCYSPSAACASAEQRFTVLIIVSAAVSSVAAGLALVGVVRGIARGWPGAGTHRIRLLVAAVLTLPTLFAAVAPVIAWLVDRYRH